MRSTPGPSSLLALAADMVWAPDPHEPHGWVGRGDGWVACVRANPPEWEPVRAHRRAYAGFATYYASPPSRLDSTTARALFRVAQRCGAN